MRRFHEEGLAFLPPQAPVAGALGDDAIDDLAARIAANPLHDGVAESALPTRFSRIGGVGNAVMGVVPRSAGEASSKSFLVRSGKAASPRSRPGSGVVLALGCAAKNRGLVQNFLQAQTTTISIDGGARVDLSDSYSAIGHCPAGVGNTSSSRHRCDAVGWRVLAGRWQAGGSHVVPDGVVDEITRRQIFFRPEDALSIDCRITASA